MALPNHSFPAERAKSFKYGGASGSKYPEHDGDAGAVELDPDDVVDAVGPGLPGQDWGPGNPEDFWGGGGGGGGPHGCMGFAFERPAKATNAADKRLYECMLYSKESDVKMRNEQRCSSICCTLRSRCTLQKSFFIYFSPVKSILVCTRIQDYLSSSFEIHLPIASTKIAVTRQIESWITTGTPQPEIHAAEETKSTRRPSASGVARNTQGTWPVDIKRQTLESRRGTSGQGDPCERRNVEVEHQYPF